MVCVRMDALQKNRIADMVAISERLTVLYRIQNAIRRCTSCDRRIYMITREIQCLDVAVQHFQTFVDPTLWTVNSLAQRFDQHTTLRSALCRRVRISMHASTQLKSLRT